MSDTENTAIDPILLVTTDQTDYVPGSTATFTATNVAVGGTVAFDVAHVVDAGADGLVGTADDTLANDLSGTAPWTVTDGGAGDLDGIANGVIVTSWNVGQDAANQSFVLSATDTATGATATTTFTDAAPSTTINPVTGENSVNGSEASAGFAITGGTNHTSDGDQVSVTIFDSAHNSVFSGSTSVVGNNGTWSLDIPALVTAALADGVYTVDATVMHGLTTSAIATDTFSLDNATINDLTVPGTTKNINDALFISNAFGSVSGTGVFPSFVQIDMQGNSTTEQGYNYDSAGGLKPQFDENTDAPHNHKVLLSDVTILEKDGNLYYVFALDSNEPNSPDTKLLSLDALKIYTANSGDLSNFDQPAVQGGTGTGFGAAANLVYDMDGGGNTSVIVDSMAAGSGRPDLAVYIPVENFGDVNTATTYVYLYSAFGYQGNGDAANSGFEEWSTPLVPGVEAGINIVKTTTDLTNPAGPGDGITATAGDAIEWTYTVTNTGNVPLSDIVVTDNQLGTLYTSSGGRDPNGDLSALGDTVNLSGDANNDKILQTNETWTLTVTGATAINGSYSNIGKASGDYLGLNVSDTDPSSYSSSGVTPSANLNLTKDVVCPDNTDHSVNGGTILAGQSVEWVYTLTDPEAGTSVSGITLTDSVLGTIYDPVNHLAPDSGGLTYTLTGDNNHDNILQSNETWTFKVTGPAATGDNANTATATGTDVGTGNNELKADSKLITFTGVTPNISIEKQVSVDGGLTWANADSPTGPMLLQSGYAPMFQYLVKNTGDVNLAPPVVTDNTGLTLSGPTGDNGDNLLNPGETWIYAATGTWAKGQNTNTGEAAVTFTDACGNKAPLDVTNDANYFGAAPNISIDKYIVCPDGQKGPFQQGDNTTIPKLLSGDVNYVIKVTNTGNVALSNLQVADLNATLGGTHTESGGSGTNGDGILDVGETWAFTAVGAWAAGSNTNTAEATASFTDSAKTTANLDVKDSVSYFGLDPHITLTKLTNGSDGPNLLQGQAITWTYDVKNDGNVGLSGVNVSDSPSQTIAAILSGGFNSGDTNHNNMLDVGETWHFQATGTAVDTSSLTGGIYSNIAKATTNNVTDDCGDSVAISNTDGSSYAGHAQTLAGLTKGYWATHLTLWDVLTGDSGGTDLNPAPGYNWNGAGGITNSSIVTSGPASGMGAVSGANNGGGDSGLLLGDLNHDGHVTGDGTSDHLFFDLASAQTLANSSVSGDARIILASQAVAAQLNEYNDYVYDSAHGGLASSFDASPTGLIEEAVQWLKGTGPLSNGDSKINWSTANDLTSPAVQAIINDGTAAKNDYTLSGGAITFKSATLSSSDPSWQSYAKVFNEISVGYHPNTGNATVDATQFVVTADGEGLKNALAAYNHGLTGTTAGFVISTDGSLIGWVNSAGSTPYDVHPNTPDAFWGILEDQNLLHAATAGAQGVQVLGVSHA